MRSVIATVVSRVLARETGAPLACSRLPSNRKSSSRRVADKPIKLDVADEGQTGAGRYAALDYRQI
jgi:hypothetical protein